MCNVYKITQQSHDAIKKAPMWGQGREKIGFSRFGFGVLRARPFAVESEYWRAHNHET